MGLEVLGLAAAAGSGLFGAVGAMQQGAAASSAARYQAQVARNNQTIAEQDAAYAAQAGAVAAQARDLKTRAALGSIEAAQSASGIDIGSPTSTAVRESAELLGRLDTETIMSNAMLQARAKQTQAMSFGAEADLAGMRASSASSAGRIGAFTSLLSGASSFSDKWLRYQNVGVPGFGSVY